MNKDVIYIDVDDDITAIIGKVKQSREKIVALVPPKRIGVLQSAVNLRLLQRTATQGGKHLVLISTNAALLALAAAAKIPVAKNLQSKPELGAVAADEPDDDEDVIDGNQLPIGEHARTAEGVSFTAMSPAVDEVVRENAAEVPVAAAGAVTRPRAAKAAVASRGMKVPNFDQFRKKLVLIGAGGALLVAFLVWAIFFAPHATVVIAARTTDTPVNARVTLDPAATTSLQAGVLKSTVKQTKKDQTVEFIATGKKDVGEKATGSMKLTRTSPSATPLTVPAGTAFTAAGLTFVSTQSATLTSQLTAGGFDPGSATVPVQATDIGDNYNLSARGYSSSVSGVSATGTDMAGGSRKTITVVSSDDIKKATEQFAEQKTDDVKKSLVRQFDTTFVVVDQSFKVDQANPIASPALDQESPDGKAKLTSSVTYSLSGVAKSEVKQYIDEYFTAQLKGKDDQRVYDNGSDSAKLDNVAPADNGKFNANLIVNAKLGPKINDDEVKKVSAGKRYGEIQASLEAIQGVDNVDVKFSPFWVTSTPNDVKRISVEFKLKND